MARAHLHVTIDAALLEQVLRIVGPRGRYPTRSAAVENALRLWLRRQLDDEIEAYYEAETEEELENERAWAESAGRALLDRLDAEEADEGRQTRKRLR